MIECIIDSSKVDEVFDQLDPESVRNIIYKSLRAGGKVLQGTTKSYFRNAMGASADHYSPYIRAPFSEGVRIKGEKAYLEVRVSIMKDFRMKFFETGTKMRKTKGHKITGSYFKGKRKYLEREGEPGNRGQIKALHFFRDARSSAGGQVEAAMRNSIDKSLRKIWNL